MLQQIRDRAQGWIAKIIVALIALTFTLFGAESLLSYFTGSQRDEVASVNGEKISRQVLQTEVQRAVRSGRVPPDQQNEARHDILNTLITRSVIEQYARNGGMSFSDQQLDQLLVNRQEFQDASGHFSADLFRTRLASAGYTPESFRAQLQEDMLAQQLQTGLITSTFVLPSEARALAQLRYQQRSFRYATLGPDTLDEQIQISDEELKAWYDAHQQDYQRPEQVRLEYVVLDQGQLPESDQRPDDQTLRQLYEQQRDNAPREVSDIIVQFGDDRTREQAQQRIEEIRGRLDSGEGFAALAKEYSDDPGSAQQGGSLGVVTEGIFGQAFDEAVASLSSGEVSPGVESDGVFHIIRIDNVDIPAFADMRDELVNEWREQQQQTQFQQLAQQLSDQSFSADDLQGVAESLDLSLHQTGWMARDAQPEGEDSVLAEAGVMEAAFSDDVLNKGYNSEPVELGANRRVVVRVEDHRPATTLPLEEVRDDVRNAALEQKRQEMLVERAEQAIDALRQGQTPSWIKWQQASGVTRDGQENVSPELANAAFAVAHPADGQPGYGHASINGEQVVFAVDQINNNVSEDQLGTLKEGLWNAQARQVIDMVTDALRDDADITIN